MSGNNLIERITEDLASVCGEMAYFFVKKRLNDLGLNIKDTISLDDVEMVIGLLWIKTFPQVIGDELAIKKLHLYLKWVNEARTTPT